MTANHSNLTPEQRLDAMLEAKRLSLGHQFVPGALRLIALDLLTRLDAAETPCVWSVDDDGIWTATCGEVEWCFNEGGPVENKVLRCCGCGHPVQVKQEDAALKGESHE